MRNPTCQIANRFHFLRLPKFLFQSLPFGYITPDDMHGVAFVGGNRGHGHLHRQQGPVRLDVIPLESLTATVHDVGKDFVGLVKGSLSVRLKFG